MQKSTTSRDEVRSFRPVKNNISSIFLLRVSPHNVYNATAVTFFTVAVALCNRFDIPALPILIGISIIATIPSMSPVASPVNAMAFGGIKGVSLKRMMMVGFIMDIIAVALLNIWVFSIFHGIIFHGIMGSVYKTFVLIPSRSFRLNRGERTYPSLRQHSKSSAPN